MKDITNRFFLVVKPLRGFQWNFIEGTIVPIHRLFPAVQKFSAYARRDVTGHFRAIADPIELQQIITNMPEDLKWSLTEEILAGYLRAVDLDYNDYCYDDDAIAAANSVDLTLPVELRPALPPPLPRGAIKKKYARKKPDPELDAEIVAIREANKAHSAAVRKAQRKKSSIEDYFKSIEALLPDDIEFVYPDE